MKFYSEKLNTLYSTEKELLKAEKEHDEKLAKEKAEKEKKSNERAARAKEVEDAAKVVSDARKVYTEKLNAFIKDYGTYHSTISRKDFDDIFDDFINFWL